MVEESTEWTDDFLGKIPRAFSCEIQYDVLMCESAAVTKEKIIRE